STPGDASCQRRPWPAFPHRPSRPRWPTTTACAATDCRPRSSRPCATTSAPTPTSASTATAPSTSSGPATRSNTRPDQPLFPASRRFGGSDQVGDPAAGLLGGGGFVG